MRLDLCRLNAYLCMTRRETGTKYSSVILITQTQPRGKYGTNYTREVWTRRTCWCWPDDEWAIVLIHIIPGHGSMRIFTTVTTPRIRIQVLKSGWQEKARPSTPG